MSLTPPHKPIKQFCLQVTTELEALTTVLHWFEQITASIVPKQLFWQCQVALAEGFTNTVRHAHQNLPATTAIDIEVLFFAHCLEIRIWNWGQPFDLASKLVESMERECKDLKEEGRGLFFMHKLTDELEYIRLPSQRNCLVMRKQISATV